MVRAHGSEILMPPCQVTGWLYLPDVVALICQQLKTMVGESLDCHVAMLHCHGKRPRIFKHIYFREQQLCDDKWLDVPFNTLIVYFG